MYLFRVVDQGVLEVPVEILIADLESLLLRYRRIVGVELERSHAGFRCGGIRSHIVGFVAQLEQRVVGVFGFVRRSAPNEADLMLLASNSLDREGAGEVSGADQTVVIASSIECYQGDRVVAELGFVGSVHRLDILGQNLADAVKFDVEIVFLALLFEQRVVDEGALSGL